MAYYDVVCGRNVGDEIIPGGLVAEHHRTLLKFCSADCKACFEKNPHRYLYPYSGQNRAYASVGRKDEEFSSILTQPKVLAYGLF